MLGIGRVEAGAIATVLAGHRAHPERFDLVVRVLVDANGPARVGDRRTGIMSVIVTV
jgi:hypothetical protein